MTEPPFRRGHSRGWQQVEEGRKAPTVTPLGRCGCTQLATPCGGAMDGMDGLCRACRAVTEQALEQSDLELAHVGGLRPGTTDVPTPHVTTLASAMRT